MSGSGFTKVNFGGMDATAGNINNQAKTIEGRLSDLEADLRPMRDSWDGFAKEAYATAQERWNAAARDLREILMAVGISVNQAGTGYRDTEQLNTRMW